MHDRHILVVEDDSEIGLLIRRHLVANDFKVTLARDGAEMDRLLASNRVDLVLLADAIAGLRAAFDPADT